MMLDLGREVEQLSPVEPVGEERKAPKKAYPHVELVQQGGGALALAKIPARGRIVFDFERKAVDFAFTSEAARQRVCVTLCLKMLVEATPDAEEERGDTPEQILDKLAREVAGGDADEEDESAE